MVFSLTFDAIHSLPAQQAERLPRRLAALSASLLELAVPLVRPQGAHCSGVWNAVFDHAQEHARAGSRACAVVLPADLEAHGALCRSRRAATRSAALLDRLDLLGD